jgi:hypothetical protein
MFSLLHQKPSNMFFLLVIFGMSLALAACATTRQTRDVKPSGFLGDYSQLREGEGKEAQLIYINPEADWAKYNAVIIDSVTFWKTSEESKISEEDAQRLTDYLYAQLQAQLSKDYQIVEKPGPGVMRLRVAITEAKGAIVVGNAVTTIIPPLRLLAVAGGVAADTSAFVGEAAVEADIRDSLTEERLAAAVDERAGGKTIRGGLKKWSHVDRAFEYWAERLRERLAEFRGS